MYVLPWFVKGRHSFRHTICFSFTFLSRFRLTRASRTVAHLTAADVILGSGWVSAGNAMFCADGSSLFDPPQPGIKSLPGGYNWSLNEGKSNLFQAN